MPEAPTIPATPVAKPVPVAQAHTREQAVAYYEKVKKQLRDLIHQKRHHDKQLALYEDNIYKAETAYLEDTQNGNIIKGFDNYIKGGVTRRKTALNDTDRIFSLSSLTYATKLQQEQESTPVTASSTPTVPDLPRLQTSHIAKSNKKNPSRKRKADDESESVSEVETPGPKRVRISFSGQGGQ
ncbi:histone acetyltransferase subunit NuA4-domain-containing protein [Tricharina praecox]|uniref:histone acetyltransferase subunit NuA4-domain-containing protein n=1 Tax=Tricharina praecox TaxID=43433 RepID=UPI002220BB3F|nr:histone acetyltransferase subunit NuA4-domain-containing protein [Tricharina praecox]KAI5846926.1 histone acetyltransferase subunit NuA4-domain-containing protein [Tricharina praecox]